MTSFFQSIPLDKWYRIIKAKCDERNHINKRLNWDKDVSVNWTPGWIVVEEIIFLSHFASQFHSACVERCFATSYTYQNKTTVTKKQLGNRIKNSRVMSLRQTQARLTDVWRLRAAANQDFYPHFCFVARPEWSKRSCFSFRSTPSTSHRAYCFFILSFSKAKPTNLCLFVEQYEDSVRDKSTVLE